VDKLTVPASQWQHTDFSGDFITLLGAAGHGIQLGETGDASNITQIEGTTVLAVRYADGVLVAGDRRATAGNTIMYDRADKVLDIDDHSVMAISGSPALAYEMARIMEYSFRYYRRSQLQELSLEGRLRTLSRLIRDNLGMAMQGIGVVLPLFATYDAAEDEGKLYFYDALGTQFEMTEFAVAGSGSVWIRGALYYQNRWQRKLEECDLREATATTLRMLESAAHYDAATGGVREQASIVPTLKAVTREGVQTLEEDYLREVYTDAVEGADVR